MTDIVDPATRSRMMSGIRGKNTRPEMTIRKELFKKGFRYRLHVSDMPGKPDLVLKKYGAVIFVHGCFWHGHKCSLFRMPSTNSEFWAEKISSNVRNDLLNQEQLLGMGWRIFTVWECAIRGKTASLNNVVDCLVEWLKSGVRTGEITWENSSSILQL